MDITELRLNKSRQATRHETLAQTLTRVSDVAAIHALNPDPAKEGLEVTMIRFFQLFPDGTNNQKALLALAFIQSIFNRS